MRNTSLLRRAAALGCAALLTFGLAACGEKEEPQTETRLYRDGTYTAQFDTAGADGYTTYAVVEIAGDKVSVTEFDGKNASGELRSADTELADSMKEGASEYLTFELTPANLSKKAMEDFAAAGGRSGQHGADRRRPGIWPGAGSTGGMRYWTAGKGGFGERVHPGGGALLCGRQL